jgi:hypothetical protein
LRPLRYKRIDAIEDIVGDDSRPGNVLAISNGDTDDDTLVVL